MTPQQAFEALQVLHAAEVDRAPAWNPEKAKALLSDRDRAALWAIAENSHSIAESLAVIAGLANEAS